MTNTASLIVGSLRIPSTFATRGAWFADGIAVGVLAFVLFVCPWMGVAALALWGNRVVDLALPVLFVSGSLYACYTSLHQHRSYWPPHETGHQFEQR